MADDVTRHDSAPRSPNGRRDRRSKYRGHLHLFWDALFKTLRFIQRRVRDVYATIGIFIALGTAVAIGAIWVFIQIAEEVREGTTQSFDVEVLRFMEAQKSEFLDRAAIEVTFLGTGVIVLMIVAVAGMFLWLTKHKHSALLLMVSTLGAVILNGLLKAGFDRPRPQVFEWGQHTVSSSFPSGHSMSAATVYMTVAYLAARLQRRHLSRVLTLLGAIIVVLLIAASRLYLGVHYPSDSEAGRILAKDFVQFLLESPAFRKDFEAVKLEWSKVAPGS